jgi:hypothetical protein
VRLVKLALGWLSICALTAAGSYYGALELDQDFGLQAKLCPNCTAAANATAPTAPNNGIPKGTPGNTGSSGNPGSTGNPPAAPYKPPVYTPPPSAPVNPQPQPTNPAPAQNNNPTYPTRPPVTYQPPQQQKRPAQPPPQTQVPAPAPGVDVSDLVARYNALLERANSINNEFAQIERDLKSQGQSLRGDIVAARTAMISSLAAAKIALQQRDGSTASRQMQVAEQKIAYLEQSR